MKKSVLINDIDVSGCLCYCTKIEQPFWFPGSCKSPFYENKCKNNPNCNYKQLQREKQKCANIKGLYTICIKELNLFKQENEKLKEIIDDIEGYIRSNTDFDIDDSIRSKTAGYDILQLIHKLR